MRASSSILRPSSASSPSPRGILPAIAAYEALGALIVDPRLHPTLVDVRTRIWPWVEGRRGLLHGEERRILPSAPPATDDPPTPAG